MNSNNLKFAVVGCGNIGKRHVAVLDKESGADLVAICDVDDRKAKDLSDLYSNLEYYTDYDDMLNNTNAEVVSIATPHGLHKEMAIQALNKGFHVLVEKPMALTEEDCLEMIKVADEKRLKLYVVKQNRYNKPIFYTKKALDEGKLGKVFMVQCNVMWNRHQEYYEDSEWRGLKSFEGGALYTQVSHFIDLLIWWFGDVVDAKSFIRTFNHNIEIEDAGVSSIEFESGVLGSLLWTTCVYNKNYEGSITIIGEKGTIKIGGKYLNNIEFWDVQSFPLPEDEVFEDEPNNYGKYQGTSSNHDKLINEIVTNFASKRNGLVEGTEGIKSINAIKKIYNRTFLQ